MEQTQNESLSVQKFSSLSPPKRSMLPHVVFRFRSATELWSRMHDEVCAKCRTVRDSLAVDSMRRCLNFSLLNQRQITGGDKSSINRKHELSSERKSVDWQVPSEKTSNRIYPGSRRTHRNVNPAHSPSHFEVNRLFCMPFTTSESTSHIVVKKRI